MRDDQLTLRLAEGALALRMSAETRARHLAVLRLEPRRTVLEVQPSLWVRARRAVAGVAIAVSVAAPAGVAVASTDALPGERLYPVKLAVEQVMGVFSEDIAARHRVAELQELIEREAGDDLISQASDAANRALVRLPDGHPLHGILTQIRSDEAEKKAAKAEEAERERIAEADEAAREAAKEAAQRERKAGEEEDAGRPAEQAEDKPGKPNGGKKDKVKDNGDG